MLRLTRRLYQQIRHSGHIQHWQKCVSPTRSCHTEFKKTSVTSSGLEYMVYYEEYGPAEPAGVVMCFHGDPGASSNFQELLQPLVDRNLRIIIPNFPGYGTTHATKDSSGKSDSLDRDGRSQLMSDFIDSLQLKRLDVVVSHSAGTWSGITVSAHHPAVKSVCFMNPCAHRPHRALRPFKFKRWCCGLLHTPLKIVVQPLLLTIYKLIGFTSSFDIRQLVTSALVSFALDFKKINEDIRLLKARNLPSVVVMTKNDKIVEWSVQYELGSLIGIPHEHCVEYNRDGGATQGEKNKDFLVYGTFKKALSFARGGHYVQRSYKEEISRHIVQLIENAKNPV
ncbi:uncharacterized protein LOC135495616 [Lineus longissimus]|uniref:uncharacterized protein LOC135495616 n=1 Tax=Lineus longissimus TaxID=88925 RepID=UPI002B4C7B70